MNIKKSHFEMNARFRNGVFLLAVLMILLIAVFYLFFKKGNIQENNFVELSSYQHQIDSLKVLAKSKSKKYTLRPFNPNFITDYKGYILGISAEELDKLFKYREQGNWVNSISDFKKVTGVSDSLLAVLSPLFKFPDWITTSNKKNSKREPLKSFAEKKDINEVTAIELQEEIGIPDFIAERIIKRRVQIDGFLSDIQLKDVYGLYDQQRAKILSLYTVKTKREISKLNINKASVKQLMDVPYFDFETAIEIRDFIVDNKGVSSFEELGKIEGFSVEKIDRIALYLKLN